MKTQLEILSENGFDIKNSLKRFLNDENFYYDCILLGLEDDNFDKLDKLLKEKKIKEAFDAAHTLKGVLLNIGATKLFSYLNEIVETLRKQIISDNLLEIYYLLNNERKNILKTIKDNQ